MLGLPLFFDFSSGETPDESAVNDGRVRRLLAAEGANAAIEMLKANLTQDQLDPDSATVNEFARRLAGRIQLDDVIDLLVPIYSEHLTPEDVRTLVAFYGSPEGRRLIKPGRFSTRESLSRWTRTPASRSRG